MKTRQHWLTQGSNGYANQMLSRLTGHNIHKKANWMANTTIVDIGERGERGKRVMMQKKGK